MRSVDVLIPFHSESEFLWEAIDSILDSRGVSIRLLLINDMQDHANALKFQELIEKRLKLANVAYLVIRNQGRSYATSLNACRNHIEGDFVAILNSDDLSAPERLRLQTQALEATGADVAVGNIVKFHGKLRLPSVSGHLKPSSFKWEHLLIGAYGSDASVVATKEIWLEHFRFDEVRRSSDWATALKVYPLLKITGADRAVYKYRIHGQQVTQSKNQISDDFLSYFPDWISLNNSLGLPDVSPNVARALSQPWVKQKLGKDEFKIMKHWCSMFRELQSDSSGSNETKSLLDRRLIISGSILFRVTQKPLLFSRMVLEYVYTRTIGSQTRSL